MSVLTPTTALEPAPSAPSAEVGYEDYLELPLPSTLQEGQLLFRILGAASIHVGTRTEIGAASERMFSLLCVCALSPDHTVARARLLELVWPDMPEAAARHSLRQHCYRLKQLGVSVHATRTSVTLSPDSLAPCFALHRTAVHFDRDVLKGNEPFGHLFGGWIPRHAALRQWVEQQRDGYHGEVRRILVPELRRLRDRAHWMECERWARTLLEFDPYNEDATLILAHALAMTGSRRSSAEVLDAYVRETGGTGTELGRRVEREQARILKSSRVVHEQSATPRLIGRDDVLSRLDDLTMRAMQGDAQIVQLVGPAGIGKTEVAYEATRRAVILGFARCVVRVSRPVGQIAHGTLSRLTRDLLQLPGALGCAPANLRLLRQFAGLEPAARLNELTESPPTAPLTECLLELMSSIAEERPLFVFVDDLHYVDRTSLIVLHALVDALHRERVFVLLTTRPETDSSPITLERPTECVLRLGPLDQASASELAAAIRTVSGASLSEEEANGVASASDGNPLLVVTLARELLLTGITPPAMVQIFESVRRQVRDLSEPARLSLRCIALAGGSMHTAVLDRAMQLDFVSRVQTVRELLASGLVRELPDLMLSVHEETLEPVLADLTAPERRIIELQLARVLRERNQEQFRAETALTAIDLARNSGDSRFHLALIEESAPKLEDVGAFSGLLQSLESALPLTESPEEKDRLVGLLARTASSSAQWRLALKTAESIRHNRTARESEDPELWLNNLEATLGAGPRRTSKTNIDDALRLAIDTRTPDRLRIRANRIAMASASNLLDPELAEEALQVLYKIRPHGIEPSDLAIEPFIQYHTVFGDLSYAATLARQIQQPVEAEPQAASWMRVFCNACFVLRFAGFHAESAAGFRSAYTSHATAQNPGRRTYAAWQLSLIGIERNEINEATRWAQRVEALLPAASSSSPESWIVLHRFRMEALTTGDIAEPRELLSMICDDSSHPSRAVLYAKGLALQSSRIRRDAKERETLLGESLAALTAYSRFGGQDLLALSALTVLEESGRQTQAESLALDYARSRRERCSLLPSIARLGVRVKRVIQAVERERGIS